VFMNVTSMIDCCPVFDWRLWCVDECSSVIV
jgi:hypothetical protein